MFDAEFVKHSPNCLCKTVCVQFQTYQYQSVDPVLCLVPFGGGLQLEYLVDRLHENSVWLVLDRNDTLVAKYDMAKYKIWRNIEYGMYRTLQLRLIVGLTRIYASPVAKGLILF